MMKDNSSFIKYPRIDDLKRKLCITVNQLIFESEKVSKVLEKPFRKLFNFEKSRGECAGL